MAAADEAGECVSSKFMLTLLVLHVNGLDLNSLDEYQHKPQREQSTPVSLLRALECRVTRVHFKHTFLLAMRATLSYLLKYQLKSDM